MMIMTLCFSLCPICTFQILHVLVWSIELWLMQHLLLISELNSGATYLSVLCFYTIVLLNSKLNSIWYHLDYYFGKYTAQQFPFAIQSSSFTN